MKFKLYKLLYYIEANGEESDGYLANEDKITKLIIALLGKKPKYKYKVRWHSGYRGKIVASFYFKKFAYMRYNYLLDQGIKAVIEKV